MTNIHQETNRYAQQYLENKQQHIQQHPQSQCTAYQGKPFQLSEIKAALAMVIIMGIICLPLLPLYWSSKWPFRYPSLTSIKPRNRFQLILKFLNFNNNTNQIPRGQPGHDWLFKIYPFLSRLIPYFQKMYIPSKHISINESMIGFKGRTYFLQYMPKIQRSGG